MAGLVPDLVETLTLLLIVGVLAVPLGGYIARVLSGERTVPLTGARSGRAGDLPRARGRSRARAAMDRVRGLRPPVRRRVDRRALPHAAAPGPAAVQPGGVRGSGARPRLQHRHQLRDEHELAGVFGRVDDVARHPGRRPRGPELRLGRDRDRRRDRPDPRPRTAKPGDHRQLLGRPDPLDPLHPPADRLRRRDRSGQPGRDPDLVRAGRRSPRCRAPSRRWPSGRSPATRRSRISARTAAGRSMPTPPIPSRARTDSRTGSRSSSCSSSRLP